MRAGCSSLPARRTQVRDYMKRTLTAALLLFLPGYSHAVEVESIGVHLFYNESGSFSENILEAEEFVLWNVIVGGGSAAEPSDRLLVKVRLKGPKDTYATAPVELTVRAVDSEDVLYAETYAGFQFAETGIAYRASMIAGHNCQPLVIEAGTVRRIVPFRCGE